MAPAMITRFAPTPSGYLHAGNAANALLVWGLARQLGGTVALRIDDLDAARYRPAYVDDIFDLLPWLGLTWQHGPRDRRDLEEHHSGRLRTARYRSALDTAAQAGLELYACRCSRRMLAGPATGGCPGGCRTASHALVPDESSLRAHVPPGTVMTVDGHDVDVAAAVGDVVVWRRDDLPAYHLASVIDDEDLGVTHIVRGADLLESTAVQLFLAPYLGAERVRAATFIHHGLLTGPDGSKLSKSQLVTGEPLPRTPEGREHLIDIARGLGAPVGITL